jgi:hypothetical protein
VPQVCATMTRMDEPQKDSQETAIPVSNPGEVITPVNTTVNATTPAPTVEHDAVAAPQAPQAEPAKVPDVATSEPETSLFKPESPPTDLGTESITWTSSEFHIHEKTIAWYLMLAVTTIVVAVVLYLWTGSIMTPVVIVICAIILAYYGSHRPDQLEYAMNNKGIRIGTKQYLYDDFQLFVVTPNSPTHEVTLIPVKRFMPPLSVRYVPDLEEKILNMLSDHLPLEERRADLVDSLMQRIRF